MLLLETGVKFMMQIKFQQFYMLSFSCYHISYLCVCLITILTLWSDFCFIHYLTSSKQINYCSRGTYVSVKQCFIMCMHTIAHMIPTLRALPDQCRFQTSKQLFRGLSRLLKTAQLSSILKNLLKTRQFSPVVDFKSRIFNNFFFKF